MSCQLISLILKSKLLNYACQDILLRRFPKIAIITRPLSTYCDTIHADLKHEIVSNMLVHENFINEQEENSLLEEIEPYLKRMRYEFEHWDNVSNSVMLKSANMRYGLPISGFTKIYIIFGQQSCCDLT